MSDEPDEDITEPTVPESPNEFGDKDPDDAYDADDE